MWLRATCIHASCKLQCFCLHTSNCCSSISFRIWFCIRRNVFALYRCRLFAVKFDFNFFFQRARHHHRRQNRNKTKMNGENKTEFRCHFTDWIFIRANSTPSNSHKVFVACVRWESPYVGWDGMSLLLTHRSISISVKFISRILYVSCRKKHTLKWVPTNTRCPPRHAQCVCVCVRVVESVEQCSAMYFRSFWCKCQMVMR